MKILHTSDWHIGRQFHNISLLDDQAHVLNQITEIAIAERVDALLIAGDIYDRSVPPATAVHLLNSVLNRFHEQGIPVILISGNHDSAQRLGFGALPMSQSGLHILSDLKQITQPVVLSDENGPVNFFGIPYCDPSEVKQLFAADVSTHDQAMACLLDQIKQQHNPNERNILLSHCFIQGGEESESERPLSIGGADRVSDQHFRFFDYVALGHLHGRQYRGVESIRYSGSILKYSFSEEKQIKSVTLVELGAKGEVSIQQHPLNPLRDMRVVTGELNDILQQGKVDPNHDDYLLVRLTDTHAILDIMGKLREVYPNVLHIERPGLLATTPSQQAKREQLSQGELSMFTDFFTQIKDSPPSEDQLKYIADLLQELHSQ